MKRLTELPGLEEVAILPYSTLVENRYLQYRGCGWRVSHILRYHNYLLLFIYDLKDAVAFMKGMSFAVRKKPETGTGINE